MKDLTQGPLQRHLIAMAVPIAAGMLFQTLYFLVDLYFVGRLGDAAIAGVGSAGNLSFLVMALSQVLGVGTVALIAQAVGRKEQAAANLVFNQAMLLGVSALVACLVCGYAASASFARTLGSDAATAAAGLTYLRWYLPSLALQFVMVAMSSALRGTGIVKPAMAVQMITVLINFVLAPILIGGWFTGRPLGVAGAGLASSIAVGVGLGLMSLYFVRLADFVHVELRPGGARLARRGAVLRLRAPPRGGVLVMFVVFFIHFLVD